MPFCRRVQKRRLLERLSAVASSVSSASKAVILSTPRATINIGPVTLAAATPVPYVSKWNDEKDDAVVVVRPLPELFRIDLSAFPANEAWDMRRKILNVLYRAAKMRNHPMCTGAFDEAIHMGGKAQVKWLYGGRLIMETERCSTTNKLFLRALAWPLTSAAMGRFIMDTCKTRMTDVFAPCALETSDIMHAVEPTAQHKVLCISDFESEAFAFFGNAVPYYVDEIKQACFECNASVTDIDLEDRNGDEKMNVQCIGQGDETVRAVCARLIETLGIKVELL